METKMMRRLILHLFVFCAIVSGRDVLSQVEQPKKHGLSIAVSRVDRNRDGYLITVEIANASDRRLFLPQSPYWRPNSEFGPRVQSLDAEQWSDGKTNLLPKGRSLSSSLPQQAGFFSVGPCRDLPFDEHWIPLGPGGHITDRIQAFEPGQHSYIPSSCGWKHARLLGPLRISVEAFPTAHFEQHDSVTASVDFPIPKR